MRTLLIIAHKEWLDGIRNRWILAIAIVLWAMAVGLAYFGGVASGLVGFTSIESTLASLASLAVVILPLIALMLGHDALIGEAERGTLLLLMTYPLSPGQLLTGKFTGQALMLAVATGLGFGSAALTLLLFTDGLDAALVARLFGALIVSAILLGWIFLAMAYALSAWVSEKGKAAGASLLLWFFFVVVFDLLMLGLLVGLPEQLNFSSLPYLMLLNPADVFRIFNLELLSDSEVKTGVMAASSELALGSAGLLGSLLVWLASLVGLARFLFQRSLTRI
ncbi:ABC transporter permease subunit [Oceanimonas sp. CHS3-5]|uniref:ABC transporter permease n=1 Tax=Oceanimonas sp. CHS3-5 TaxID=3068186 RepID=UPI00273FF0CB|nr:ABC transporter permease subunit [Oceanimonas sp. CHS3-5]MDP5293376.1 ABC transporter permease subunit [Oceanimonas sp. CHS3-5]